ncbi:MAG TPA: polymer-forming cytoskeletal protein [Steroidobacteraceae bacterium]|jgi:cytoskeletal protein CcmA (bactofilin family)|nr:polymer-forming cytoskeletal protein [Steroidobacteraceae bacterium]
MFKRRDNSHMRIDTLIGRNASIQGDVEFSGGLHVDGCVAGGVRAGASGAGGGDERGGARPRTTDSLSVSEHGVIQGSVEAPHVVLNGRVDGDIFGSERVVLGSKARVRGNVHYGVIEMAMGAEITGKLVPRCNNGTEPGPGVATPDPGPADGMDAQVPASAVE